MTRQGLVEAEARLCQGPVESERSVERGRGEGKRGEASGGEGRRGEASQIRRIGQGEARRGGAIRGEEKNARRGRVETKGIPMRVDTGAWRREAETRAWPRCGEVRLCEATTSELEVQVEVKTEAWHRTRRGEA
jgi:hypothetical protein